MKSIALLLAGLTDLALAAEFPAPGTVPKALSSADWPSIRAACDAGRHAVHRQENGTLAARNPGQQWSTEFDGKGILVTPVHDDRALELTGYGERTLPVVDAPKSRGTRVSPSLFRRREDHPPPG